LRELARGYTRECVETLATIMQTAPRTADRIEAASILLSRGWGLPTQPVTAEGEVMIAVSEITRAGERMAAYFNRGDEPAALPPARAVGSLAFEQRLARLFDVTPDNGGPTP
jgi:hypothetical protein